MLILLNQLHQLHATNYIHMDESHKHDVEQVKPDTEDLPNDSIYIKYKNSQNYTARSQTSVYS